MMEKCFDIGTIQAFLDGELAPDRLETVARHVSLCDNCAMMLATAEEETAFAFSALEQEFNTLVPTQRLWLKINDSIESERKSFWKTLYAFFSNPTVGAFATLLIVFGLFVVYLNKTATDNTSNVVATTESRPSTTLAVSNPPTVNPPVVDETTPAPKVDEVIKETQVSAETKPKSYQVVNTKFDSTDNIRKPVQHDSVPNTQPNTVHAVYQYLPGEESYLKTIATLEKTVDSRKDEVMKPSAQVAYAKNMALVDDAIKKMKAEVKKNPNNEGAKQVLFASYQNKIDLLNAVNEKTELMVALR